MPVEFSRPLTVDEVISVMRDRWKATYDLQLVVRGNRLYLHLMWAYLEQQSFPLDEESYRFHLADVLEVINRLGLSCEVREWLVKIKHKPRLGRAISLRLNAPIGLEEFLV